MGCPFLGEGNKLKGTERDMGEGGKNVHFLGDVLIGCSQYTTKFTGNTLKLATPPTIS